MAGGLKGKVALITGGSRGIGKAIALKLADEGVDIIINYFRRKSIAEQTVRELCSKKIAAFAIKANLAEPQKIESMFNEIESRFGRLDILINNAATGFARSALDLEDRHWDWVMDINARAFLLCAQRAVGLMREGGKIISISSIGSRMVLPIYTAVGVSKAALEALTRYLAIELAPHDICVNGIAAGAVESEALKMYTAGQDLPPASWKTTPAGRMVQGKDIADVAAFLCHDEASMIRGQIIVIDGGVSLSPFAYTDISDHQGESHVGR